LPGVEETISYRIPTHGMASMCYFAAFKRHWSLSGERGVVRAQLKRELAAYEGGKGTVRFPLSEPVPDRLVDRIVRKLAGFAQSRARTKKAKARPKSGARRRTKR
jgi:uncharacterized protein YdhG (YjbR/CyaY superfamily)